MNYLPRFLAGFVTGTILTLLLVSSGWAQGAIEEIKVHLHNAYEGIQIGTSEGESLNWRGPISARGERDNIAGLIGASTIEIINTIGEPQRKDPGEYGFDWWIYNADYLKYMQVGVKNGIVVAIYTNSPGRKANSAFIGQTREELGINLKFLKKVSFNYQNSDFTISLEEADYYAKPITIENNLVAEYFFDIHANKKLRAVRIMELDSFLTMAKGHCRMQWTSRGQQPSLAKPVLIEAQLDAVERAYENQIFDLVNATRVQYGLPVLLWEDKIADVARSHSQDMLEHNFFAHVSPYTGNLATRLRRGQVKYRIAAENIAYNYVDAIAAHEGWLNSLKHRENVLSEEFQYLGVGVEREYYTQNYIAY